MDEYEKYLFDLNGYLVLEDVLTPQEVAACNEAMDRHAERIRSEEEAKSGMSGATAFKGDRGLGYFTGMLTWDMPWCQPFRDMLAHPRVMSCLSEMLGEAFRLDHIYGITMRKDTGGLSLHGGGHLRHNLVDYYGFLNDRMCCGVTVVSWALTDSGPGDGGFACIPGSHKANYPLPRDMARLEKDLGVVEQVPVKAGSVIIFPEALAHGTLPWKADHERRSVLYKYAPGAMTHNPPDSSKHPTVVTDTLNYRPRGIEEVLDELTPVQRALLEPPYHPRRFDIPVG
jgi:ectoine hydroxylase-related dioxygenase (phytanoyl-CoA dioxygenase family)